MQKARELKDKASTIFQDACFTLHKWHSNVPEVEAAQSKLKIKKKRRTPSNSRAAHKEPPQSTVE